MVVEDDMMIRDLLKRILERFGYTVLLASHGGEALTISERHEESIDLMITDVVMPQMNGYEIAEWFAEVRPEMSVLYMSGYDEEMVANQGPVDGAIRFIQKPFVPTDVANKVREILDKRVSGHPRTS